MSPPSEVHGGPLSPSSTSATEDDSPFFQMPGLKYPGSRDAPDKGSKRWLEDRRDDDGAEGLWRFHDTLYDFSSFADRHPGGAQWIYLTKGTDITEAFESHHISPVPATMVHKFAVRPARTPRNSPYTFLPDGFYAKLRSRVYEIMPAMSDRGPARETCIFLDTAVCLFLTTAVSAAYTQSTLIATVAALLLGISTVAAHNFLDMRDTFRRYYFDLSPLSSNAWRVSHSLSHHMFPNTASDLEITLAEPFLFWLPSKKKPIIVRYVSWVYSPIIYSFIFSMEGIRRVIIEGFQRTDLITWSVPAAMVTVAPSGHVVDTFFMWVYMLFIGSMYFGFVGFNAAHHHPTNFHEGDAPRVDRDWGLAQLDAVQERTDVSGVDSTWIPDKDGKPRVIINNSRSYGWWTLCKVLMSFGHHSLHHLFPTIDHANLPRIYPVLAETLTEIRVAFRTNPFSELIKGQFLQLARTDVNTVPHGYLPITPVGMDKQPTANYANHSESAEL